MIPSKQLNKRARNLYNDIVDARVTIDGTVIDGALEDKTIDGNIIKVHVGLSSYEGSISKIDIIDKDGDIVHTKTASINKSNKYKFITIVEIRVESEVLYE